MILKWKWKYSILVTTKIGSLRQPNLCRIPYERRVQRVDAQKKHAYLIVAHSNFKILKLLLKLLDDDRNDIFIHIDKKVGSVDFEAYKNICKASSVYYTPDRIDVAWGRCSIVDAEMLLFSTAHAQGPYAYYHLISGVDLPLKTQGQIHDYFRGRSESFIDYSDQPSQYYARLSLYHYFPIKGKAIRAIEKALVFIQRKIGYNRFKKWEKKGYTFEMGANWVSLTDEAVQVLLSEKETIKKMTRGATCCDETYKQIVLKKAGVPIYRDRDGKTNCLRYIIWSRTAGTPHPYVFKMSDYELLMNSNQLFARKFDQNTDFEIVEAICRELTTKASIA